MPQDSGAVASYAGRSECPRSRGGAENDADAPHSAHFDADLQQVVDVWPTFPEAVKAGIVAMVDAAKASDGDA